MLSPGLCQVRPRRGPHQTRMESHLFQEAGTELQDKKGWSYTPDTVSCPPPSPRHSSSACFLKFHCQLSFCRRTLALTVQSGFPSLQCSEPLHIPSQGSSRRAWPTSHTAAGGYNQTLLLHQHAAYPTTPQILSMCTPPHPHPPSISSSCPDLLETVGLLGRG